MFTGLVQDVGRVRALARRGDAADLEVETAALDAAALAVGESVAVDGACLTVTARERGRFRALASWETLKRTTLGGLRPGDRVNLERALLPTDRLGGHFVLGHVDGVGELAHRRPVGPAVDLGFRAGRDVLRLVVAKGSVAVDGISLTVVQVDEYLFSVAMIPHTLERTTLKDKPVGARVNLESDVVGKYVDKLVAERLAR